MEKFLAFKGGKSRSGGDITGDERNCSSWMILSSRKTCCRSDHKQIKYVIKSTLIRGWKPSRIATFKVLGENLFLVEFEHVWDKARVLEGQP
jgi:hypothetical protein